MSRRVALLVNPLAGRGKAGTLAAETACILSGYATVDIVETGSTPAGFLAATSRAAAAGPDAIVVCGGDGTVHVAANVLAGGAIPLGIVPAGSGNDIADMLGIDRESARAAHQIGAAAVAGSTHRIDIGRCDGPRLVPGSDRAFVGLLYAGFDAAVNARANRMRRVPVRARYNVALAIETLRLRARPMTVTVSGGSGSGGDDAAMTSLEGETAGASIFGGESIASGPGVLPDWMAATTLRAPVTLVAVGNGAQYGGGKRIAPGASWYDGLFEVAVIGKVSRTTLARLAPTLPRGGHAGHPAAYFAEAREVVLAAPHEAECYADGEPVGRLPVRAWVEPAALPVLVPMPRPGS